MHKFRGLFRKRAAFWGASNRAFHSKVCPQCSLANIFHSQAGVKSEQSTTNFQVIFHHDFLQRTVAGRPLREMAFAVEVMAVMPQACK
jgi:hypothetical protein